MPARRALIPQSDLTRVAKAMQAAGVEEWRVEVSPEGKVAIIASKKAAATAPNEWDEVLDR